MIHLGLSPSSKAERIAAYCAKHAIRKVFLLSPKRFAFPLQVEAWEAIDWLEIIKYRTFYRLLQEIDSDVLVVVNECLRLQNRNDLTYNCIRQFLNQTKHVLVFQTLPLIDEPQDFMILFDFATKSKWKREKFDADLVKGECAVSIEPMKPAFHAEPVPVSDKVRADYAAAKEKLFRELGLKDPHTIPRNLYLLGGKAKAAAMKPDLRYVGRNNRIGAANLITYGDEASGTLEVFELPHNFLHFADLIATTRQTSFDVLRADLKVDHWYLSRYGEWAERIAGAYATLQ